MRTLLIVICIATAFLGSCKEPFPVYDEPTNVLVASLQRTSGDTLYFIQDDKGTPFGTDQIRLKLLVTNVYPQLLQGEALISGRVDFFVTAPVPKVGFAHTLTRSDMVQPPLFQNSIAVPPNTAAEFRIDLSPSVPGGAIYDGVPSNEVDQPDSTKIITYLPMTITVDATVQIFQRVQPIKVKQLSFRQVCVQMILKSKN